MENEKDPNLTESLETLETHAEDAEKYLGEKAKAGFYKSKTLVATNKKGKSVAQCVYYAVTVPTSQKEKGVAAMAAIFSDLADKGFIHSILAPISSIDLAMCNAGQVPASAVYFFPLVFLDKVEEAKSKYGYSVEEGQTGKILGSLKLELPPGEFYASHRVTEMMNLMAPQGGISTGFDFNGYLYDGINEYMKFLPKGTKFLGLRKLAISDLSIPYEFRFFCEMLPDVKRVDLDWVRHCAVVDDKLKQANLFLGVRYFDKDDKELYNYRK